MLRGNCVLLIRLLAIPLVIIGVRSGKTIPCGVISCYFGMGLLPHSVVPCQIDIRRYSSGVISLYICWLVRPRKLPVVLFHSFWFQAAIRNV